MAFNRAAFVKRHRELAQKWASLIIVGLRPLGNLVARQDL